MFHLNRNRKPDVPSTAPGHWSRSFLCSGMVAGVVAVGSVAAYAQNPSPTPNYNKPLLMPEANRPPDANQLMIMRENQSKKANFEAANVERKRQIADDSARLLKLATDLKTEVDKTSKDTLSVGVIRKAEEIEKLAHAVREKMKLTMNGN